MKLWGQEYTKNEFYRRVGDLSAAGGVRKTVLEDGKGRGMRAYEVKTGSGLCFTVVPDRGLDIMHCDYKGIPLAFISKTGLVAPGVTQYGGMSFLRSFTAGLLTTCGLKQSGAKNTDNGEELALHGRYHALPAEEVSVRTRWEGDEADFIIEGRVREAEVFSENLCLHREIKVRLGESRIIITDTLENAGFSDEDYMLLYHCNFGHPLVDDGTLLTTGPLSAPPAPRDAVALAGLQEAARCSQPVHQYKEQCFYYKPQNPAGACLFNPRLGLGAALTFNSDNLPYLIQWKQMGEGDYVVGLEPSTNKPEGRAAARAAGELCVLPARSTRTFKMEIAVVTEQLYK